MSPLPGLRIAAVMSHPVQYHAPLFREIARRASLHVYYTQEGSPSQQAESGFGIDFTWDIDLLSGYDSTFLNNVAQNPNPSRFFGADTPGIYHHLRGGNYDAVLVGGWNLKSFLQCAWAAKRLKVPVLVRGDSQLDTPRSPAKRALKACLWPLFLRQFSAALYVGSRSRRYFENYGFPKHRLFYSPHAVDTLRFASGATSDARNFVRGSLGASPDEKLVLFAGKLIDRKRPFDAVDMVALLRQQGLAARLVVAGAGPLETAIAQRATTRDVPVHLLGFQNQSQLPSVYAAADVLVLPSDATETWGLVCNEAIACGTPIVVSDQVGCAPDLASREGVGLQYPTGDIQSGSAALASILSHPPDLLALKAASDDHSIPAAVDGILRAARQLVHGPR